MACLLLMLALQVADDPINFNPTDYNSKVIWTTSTMENNYTLRFVTRPGSEFSITPGT